MTFFFALASFFFLFFSPSPSSAEEGAASPPQSAAFDAAMTESAASALPPVNTTTQIVVSVSVNLESKGDFFAELDDDKGNLFLKVEDLVALKLNFVRDRVVLIRSERYVPLSAVLEISSSFNEKNLTLSILGKTTELQKTEISVFSLQTKPQNVYYPRETSAFLNYGVAYAYADPLGFQSFTATNKLGLRAGDVFFVSDSLYAKTEASRKFVRLQSSATYERREELQWLVLGDQFANSGDLGSTLNMGGIGFSKVYKIDPYYITQPVFDLKGVSAFPSQAEIYLDRALVGKQQIAAGSFDLKNIYSYAGSHSVDVVLRDPFGNEQRISYPLYFSAQLLREGLHEYSYNAGFQREQYGVEGNEYGTAVFSAFHRYGVTSAFNIGARAEGSDKVRNAGLSTSFLVPRFGAFILSVAGSSVGGVTGSAGSFQHSYQLGSFSTNLLAREFTRDYATIGSPSSSDMIRYETSAGVGFSLPPMGSVSLNYAKNQTFNRSTTRIAGASYSRALSRATSLFATASATRTTEMTYGFFIGLNFSLDSTMRGAASYSKTGSADTETVQMQKDIPVGEGLGYRATLNRNAMGSSSSSSFSPFLQYNARYGSYSVDSAIRHVDGQTSEAYTVSAAGALVYAGGFYGLSRPVGDSFGFVMVGNLPNAAVLNNGQIIGKTDASGLVVVPTLASYNQNQISVDTKNIPMDYSISGVNATLSPSLWSGSCMAFEALRIQAVTGSVFIQKADKKIPLEYVEISMSVGEKEVTFPTGKGGEFYVENVLSDEKSSRDAKDRLSCRAIAELRKSGSAVIKPGLYHASVDYEGNKCGFSVIFPVTEDVIWDLGEIRCLPPDGAR